MGKQNVIQVQQSTPDYRSGTPGTSGQYMNSRYCRFSILSSFLHFSTSDFVHQISYLRFSICRFSSSDSVIQIRNSDSVLNIQCFIFCTADSVVQIWCFRISTSYLVLHIQCKKFSNSNSVIQVKFLGFLTLRSLTGASDSVLQIP